MSLIKKIGILGDLYQVNWLKSGVKLQENQSFGVN